MPSTRASRKLHRILGHIIVGMHETVANATEWKAALKAAIIVSRLRDEELGW